jgi:ketosteroid isomerase-like protein
MATQDVVRQYFDALAHKGEWQTFLSDDLRFTSLTSPVKEVTGKVAYLEATRRFFSMILSVEVRDLIVDGVKACALTRYQLRAPTGAGFQSDVAEIVTVRGSTISTLAIYFDTSPFPK